MFAGGQSATQIVAQKGLTQITDESALIAVVRQVLDANPGPVQQFMEGKETVLAFLIGQVMRATRGQANAQVARDLLQHELAGAGKPASPVPHPEVFIKGARMRSPF